MSHKLLLFSITHIFGKKGFQFISRILFHCACKFCEASSLKVWPPKEGTSLISRAYLTSGWSEQRTLLEDMLNLHWLCGQERLCWRWLPMFSVPSPISKRPGRHHLRISRWPPWLLYPSESGPWAKGEASQSLIRERWECYLWLPLSAKELMRGPSWDLRLKAEDSNTGGQPGHHDCSHGPRTRVFEKSRGNKRLRVHWPSGSDSVERFVSLRREGEMSGD